MAGAIVIGVIAVAVIAAVFVWTLSRRRTARDAGGVHPLAGREPETLQGDRADRQAATEEAARRRLSREQR